MVFWLMEGDRENQVDSGSLLTLLILAGVYFLPVTIAWSRKSRQAVLITVLTVLLAWTVVGWVIFLIMAVASARRDAAAQPALAAGSPQGFEPGPVQVAPGGEAADSVTSRELDQVNYARRFLLESSNRKLIDDDTYALLLGELNAVEPAWLSEGVPAAGVAAPAMTAPPLPLAPVRGNRRA